MSLIYKIRTINHDTCTFWPTSRIIKNSDKNSIRLTTTEAKMLWLLCSHEGKNLERVHIENEVWCGRGVVPSETNLNQLVCTLRKKIKSVLKENIIVTVPRVGFVLSDTVEIISQKWPPIFGHDFK